MESNNRFFDLQFYELDVILLLKDINPSKTTGPDGMHGMILKNCTSSLAKPLTIMFNISFVTGSIPNDWNVILLLKDINPSKTTGPDGIHGMILRNCTSSLSKPLTIMFNISFVTGSIPNDWKLASVVSDEKGSVKNFRPISLTSLIMKIFERCIRKDLLNSCEQFIGPRQHGFTNANHVPHKWFHSHITLLFLTNQRSM